MESPDKLLEKLIKKYNLQQATPAEIQKGVLKQRKSALKKILKKKQKYNLLLFLAISLNIFFRRFGWKFSILQCKFFALLIIFGFAGSASFITYKALIRKPEKIFIKPEIQVKQQKHVLEKSQKTAKTEKRVSKKVTAAKKTGITVKLFKSEDKINAKKIRNILSRDLNKIKLKNKQHFMLIGSFKQFDESYTITTKLINTETSQAVLIHEENFVSLKDLNKACLGIIQKVKTKLK